MHHHITGKGNGEVIAQALLAELCCKMQRIALQELVVGEFGKIVARIEHLEEQFVALLAILAHKRRKGLHGRGFYLLEAIQGVYFAYCVEYVVALCHLHRREVARAFRY